MKKVLVFMLVVVIVGCQENEAVQNEFTGNEVVYALQSGSIYPVSGTATFKERKDGTTRVMVKLTGTEGSIEHPVHLHMGSVSAPDAEVVALLTPVKGSVGKSETVLTMLSDETPVTYAQLVAYEACIKVHLAASGPDRDIILAAGNIGESVSARTSGEIAICKSE